MDNSERPGYLSTVTQTSEVIERLLFSLKPKSQLTGFLLPREEPSLLEGIAPGELDMGLQWREAASDATSSVPFPDQAPLLVASVPGSLLYSSLVFLEE